MLSVAKKTILAFLILATGFFFFKLDAYGGGFPSHPITYIIPFNPGGQSDIQARLQQGLLEKELHVPIVITYEPGGGGALGWSNLVHGKADGYTVAGINLPHIILQPLVRGKSAGYETNQILPLAFFQRTPIGLAVLKTSPFKTLKQLVAYAKAHPGAVTISGVGVWTGHYMTYLELEKAAGIKLTYIPSTGDSETVTNLLGGSTKVALFSSNDFVSYKSKLRVLAIASSKRLSFLPNIPTFKEQGYNIVESIDRGVGVKQGTPKAIVDVLEKAFIKAMHNKDTIAKMKAEGFEPIFMNMQQSEEHIKKLKTKYELLLKQLNIHFKG
ncbi:MAG: tripartite tricarboxylate transporter substrate binding protein [Conexivisphaerales archaeon]